jgi:hypothetical protein
MSKITRDVEDLRAASKHVYYEIAMVAALAELLQRPAAPSNPRDSEVVHNALLESFAMHARVLADFFGLGRRPSDDDVVASDFVDGPAAQRLRDRLLADARFEPVRVRVNKDLAHLTYTRTEYGPEGRQWNAHDVFLALQDVLNEFAVHVRREQVDDELWRDLVEPARELLGVDAVDLKPPEISPGRTLMFNCLTATTTNTIAIRMYGCRDRGHGRTDTDTPKSP